MRETTAVFINPINSAVATQITIKTTTQILLSATATSQINEEMLPEYYLIFIQLTTQLKKSVGVNLVRGRKEKTQMKSISNKWVVETRGKDCGAISRAAKVTHPPEHLYYSLLKFSYYSVVTHIVTYEVSVYCVTSLVYKGSNSLCDNMTMTFIMTILISF